MQQRPALIIDEDMAAAKQLADLLLNCGYVHQCFFVGNMADAQKIMLERRIGILFIRIIHWDKYRRIIPLLNHPPEVIVFLSGRMEKCTYELSEEVDFHLQPPFRRTSLIRVFARLLEPGFRPRSLDFFFLKCNHRFRVVYFDSLRAVSSKGGYLTVRTDKQEYFVAGSLRRLEERLPPLFCRINRNLIIAEQYLAVSSSLCISRNCRKELRRRGQLPDQPLLAAFR
jgi:DNA-binding LytR/AlgR family response regulator